MCLSVSLSISHFLQRFFLSSLSIIGQCEISFPSAAVRKGINYLKNPSAATKSHTNTNPIPNSNGPYRNTNISQNTKNKSSNNSVSTSSNIKSGGGLGGTKKNNISNNIINKSVFPSFQEGYQFTAEELWQRMRTRGGKKNSLIGPFNHTRISFYSQSNSHSQSDLKNFNLSGVTKSLNRKNSISSASNDNLGSFGTYGHGMSASSLKKNPQPLCLRQDLVTYLDGANYGTRDTTLSPTAPSSSSKNIPMTDPTSDLSSSPSSLTTAFTTSTFTTTLLSKNVMGTVVLPDLIVLTNEIPWCTIANEFAILTAEDISFDSFGKYVRINTPVLTPLTFLSVHFIFL